MTTLSSEDQRADPSPATEATVDVESSAPAESSDVSAGSSPAPGARPKSFDEAMAALPVEADPAAAGTTDEAENSPPPENAEAGEASHAEATGQDEPEAKAGEADGSLNVSYDKRPEWKALARLAPELEKLNPGLKLKVGKILTPVFEREKQLREQVHTLSEQAGIVREFRAHAGDEQGFQTMRQIVRAYATDPEAAVPILENMLNDARQRAGLVVSSADLRERLDAGELDEKTAVELESARQKAAQARHRLTQAEQDRQRQQAQQAEQRDAAQLNSWEENIRSRDPNFGDVTDESDPEHGRSVADQVFDALRLKKLTTPQATAAELIAEATRVHRLARARLNGSGLKAQKVVTSQGSSVTARPKARTYEEHMALNVRPERA